MILSPESAMQLALSRAYDFRGSTSPNPPVGAVGLDAVGRILAVAAHERAGEYHAERRLLEICESEGTLHRLHTLVVTLEPCSHLGKTPACTEAILESPVRKVIMGTLDPNPEVSGRGIERLKSHDLEVKVGVLESECKKLIRPFVRYLKGGRPWTTVKTAWTAEGSMIPPEGQKTFTSRDSLRLAHELRRRSDAIITGSGTVLADSPLFTVRHLQDHPGKSRHLIILDRRMRIPGTYIDQAMKNGFQVRCDLDLEGAFEFLKSQGVLDVLVEAGPTLTKSIIDQGYWDEQVVIQKQSDALSPDQVDVLVRDEAIPGMPLHLPFGVRPGLEFQIGRDNKSLPQPQSS